MPSAVVGAGSAGPHLGVGGPHHPHPHPHAPLPQGHPAMQPPPHPGAGPAFVPPGVAGPVPVPHPGGNGVHHPGAGGPIPGAAAGPGPVPLLTPADQARRRQDLDTLCQIISQWNANRLDLFALSLPNEDLEFHGVMRFYYQSQDREVTNGQKVATKCIRVSSTATTKAIIETLIEKFRPDMKMLEVPEYALYEIHKSGERRLNPEEKPLLVQLNWHKDDREGRFLLRRIDEASRMPEPTQEDTSFKRKLSKREKKQLKKQEKLNKIKEKEGGGGGKNQEGVAEKLYTELPDTSFTRSISNPEAVMRRRRQQKLEKKLQQFRSKDGGPDTGGTLKIYGEALCRDVPYKTLLLSISDSAAYIVEEMLEKYGRDRREAPGFCLVQVTSAPEENGGPPGAAGGDAAPGGREYYLDDDECPLAILMNHIPSRGTVTFHVKTRPPQLHQQRRLKKKGPAFSHAGVVSDSHLEPKLPFLTETNADGTDVTASLPLRYVVPPNVTEVGSDPALQQSGLQCLLIPPAPFVFPRHCVLAHTADQATGVPVVTVTPRHVDAETYVNQKRIFDTTILQHGTLVRFGRGGKSFRFLDPTVQDRERMRQFNSSVVTLPPDPQQLHQMQQMQQMQQMDAANNSNYAFYPPQQQQQPQVPQLQGKDNILPAVLEFREENEEAFFNSITVSLEVGRVQFKLAPTYTIYMATRFRASTHYRPELVPEERAVRLTEMLNQVAENVYSTVRVNQHDAARLAFWMANSSELLNFLKSDRHITSFSLQAQDILAETVHLAFKQLVLCLQGDLKQAMPQMLHPSDDDDIGRLMQVMTSAMNLLRKCRVNAALTIQLFSQLFHFVNMWTFNQLVSTNSGVNYCTHRWGLRLKKRLAKIEGWAEKQGLELAADCHLARVVQAAHLLLARKNTAEDIASVSSICFKLNSLQLKTLLNKYEPDANETPISADMVDTIVRVAQNTVDEMTNSEGREVRLEEDAVLQLPFLLPEDGYSCDIVRGVPSGLGEFIAPLQNVGLCVMTPQPSSSGFWTIYMDRLDLTPMMSSPGPPRSPSEMSQNTLNGTEMMQQPKAFQQPQQMQPQQQHLPPNYTNEPEVQLIQLAKYQNGMGLSIVAAKGVGKDRLGIYIKAVVEGGAAHHDGRLKAGDQLLSVDGQSLVGITQERAAEIMMHTGPVVELEVAKQGAIYHGLAALLSQPSPVLSRASNSGPPAPEQQQQRSKSVSSLYGQQPHPQQQQDDGQPTYQNQSHPPPLLRSTTAPGLQQAAGHNGIRPQFGNTSVQNLASAGPRGPAPHFVANGNPLANRQPSAAFSSPPPHDQEQAFYQNVGNPAPRFVPPQHFPSPGGTPREVVASPEAAGGDLFHATPRIIGTPASSGGDVGPAKPQRQHAYGGQQQDATPVKKVSQSGGRVRFQEPENNKEMLPPPPPPADSDQELGPHIEQLRLSNVEKEFRRRVAEYKRETGEEAESDAEKQKQLDAKREELEAQRRAEERLLAEAERRRREASSGSGNTPPPIPQEPPPMEEEDAPAAASGAQRLDMLLSGGGSSSSSSGKPKEAPAKRVSFKTDEAPDMQAEGNGGGEDEGEQNDDEEEEEAVNRHEDPDKFINDAENLLNSSTLALEKFDLNKSTGHTPSVIGAQEVYRDPRQRRLQKAQEEKATAKQTDGAKLSFKEKMKLFAVEAGESTPKDKAKISKAQREIDGPGAEGPAEPFE